MIVTHHREKLIQAIVYFAQHTLHCGKIKLFKLLFLLDFEHFRMTGRSVTGSNYHAWKYGPVPMALAEEWDELQPDMAARIAIRSEQVIHFVRETVIPTPGTDFDDSHFSKRELRLLDELAVKYRDEYSPKMIDVTHAENGAWAKVWREGHGFDQPIPYILAIAEDDPYRDSVLEMADEYAAIAKTYRYSPTC